MAITIEVVPALKDNFVYLLHAGNAGLVIDPSEAAPILRRLGQSKIELKLILCTHHHWDHVGGAVELARQFGCPIWASHGDMNRIEGCSRGLNDGEIFTFSGQEFKVLHVPGHTIGQISYYVPDSKAVFVGDTLFSLGCGRLFEGTAAEMYASLQRISNLPGDTRIYFGHEYTLRNGEFARKLDRQNAELEDYLEQVRQELAQGRHSTPTLLEVEKRINPFLNARSLEEWTRRRELRNVF